MTKRVEVYKEYRRYHGQKAIDKFFEANPELDYWKETFEWMLINNVDFFSDNVYADGTRNNDWCYALHLDDDDDFTYICIIERQ